MKIILLQRIIPHYRLGLFNHLLNNFSELEIVYGNPKNSEILKNASLLKDERFIFRSNFYIYNENIFFSNVINIIYKKKPKVVISVFNIGNINILFLFLFRKIFNYKVILWSFGYDPAIGFNPQNFIKDKIRLFFYQKADSVIFYWEKGRELVSNYSKKTGHYFVAPNTLDTKILIDYKKQYDNIGKTEIKKEFGILEDYNFIFVGRLISDKEIMLLLRAFLLLKNDFSSIRLSIIGDGPERFLLNKFVLDNSIKDVYFLGEILNQDIVSKWIYISDAFCFT